MKVSIEDLLAMVVRSGCAVAPVHVDALVTAVRKYAGLISEMALMLDAAGCLTEPQMTRLIAQMEDARTCEMPMLPIQN